MDVTRTKDLDSRRKHRPQENSKLLSHKQKDEIKKAFDYFDHTGSGIINVSDLKVVFRALGFDPTNEEIAKLVSDFETETDTSSDEEKKIDFQRFLEIIIYKMVEPDSDENIRKSFSLFQDSERLKQVGADNVECISKRSLLSIVQKFDEDITEEEVEELIIRAVNKAQLLKTSELQNDEKDKKIDFDSSEYFVSLAQFMKMLNEDTPDQKDGYN